MTVWKVQQMVSVDTLLKRFGITPTMLWIATVGLGVWAGVGGYTFFYAHGLSYVSDDPTVCTNCHVMQPYYDGWVKTSHHTVATCNDCHTPHAFIGKYLTKGENGFHHSKAFTLQRFHEPIMIREKNARIVQQNCLRCHGDLVSNLLEHTGRDPEVRDCVRCHAGVGHGPD